MGDAVVFNDGAVTVGATVKSFAVAVGGDVIAEQAGEDNAVAELAGGAKQNDLFANVGRVPLAVSTGPRGDPRKPSSGQWAGFYSYACGLHLDFDDGTEADEVFDQASEGG